MHTNSATFEINSKGKKKMPAAQLKKMQEGLKKYRAEMDKLRDKAAKQAKITPTQYKKYLEAMRSPECMAEGRLAGVKAAEVAKISVAKYKAFTKAYKKFRDEYKAKKAESKSSVSLSMAADKEQKVRMTLKKVYAAIQSLRKRFHAAKSESDRNILRQKMDGFKLHYNKLYSMLNGTPYYHVASDMTASEEAEVSDATQSLLEKTFDLATFLNLVQSDKFYDWYAGPFSSWLAEEEGAPNDDQIVEWVAKNLEG